MKKQLSILAILVGASLNAQAAQSSFFTIVDNEVKGYANGISTDGSGLIGINAKNNTAEYFSTVQFADFLVDRFRFEQG
ncbi:MAG: GlyGly-CTERM sorting domain-containing protein, partial [Aeromonas sp.]